MTPINCKCGGKGLVKTCISTGRIHNGYVVACQNEHTWSSPIAKTPNGAIRIWNSFMRSGVPIEMIIMSFGIGWSIDLATKIAKERGIYEGLADGPEPEQEKEKSE